LPIQAGSAFSPRVASRLPLAFCAEFRKNSAELAQTALDRLWVGR